ncbi:MAG: hypothetical protein IPI53_17580 [Saprospiraceae bacterium]|nr:hypothetical protein [Saprospiraceae bacterium]
MRDYEFKELTQRVSKGIWQYEALELLNECLDLFNIQHDSLSAKAPLRFWFHAFTVLRNKTKGHGAPKFEPCSMVCPKLLKSINLIIDNLTLFNRPWAYFYRNLSGKYRISYLSEDSNEFDNLKGTIKKIMKTEFIAFLIILEKLIYSIQILNSQTFIIQMVI